MIEMTILLRRKPEMSHDEFVSYHRNNHAPLFSSLAEVKQQSGAMCSATLRAMRFLDFQKSH